MRDKRGRKPAFSREDVIATAVEIGIDRATITEISRRLGVVPAALYRLFESRDDIIHACLDQIQEGYAVPAPGMEWRELLQLWADESWRMCEEIPGLENVLYGMPTAMIHIDNIAKVYAEALVAGGRTPGQALFAISFVSDTVLVSHLGIIAMRSCDESGTRGLDRIIAQTGPEAFLQPDPSWIETDSVSTKLNFIFEGLERDWPELAV
ncbi:TetR/AcrR family transcriptional regulator [Corynebacterium sp. A21]|uniref:TetR/AcrR family transcriptional regulator n=1 Tax=Corynebacterium sp. A21 TaxID=3457318 RepID=UPI003FD13F8B